MFLCLCVFRNAPMGALPYFFVFVSAFQICYARFVKCRIIYNPGLIIYKSRKFSDF